MSLEGKITIVTGSSTGIGEAVAKRFASEGARVVVNSFTDPDGGERVVSEIRSAGGSAIHVQADVTVPGQVEELFARTDNALGQLDVLVNNAGRTLAKPFLEITSENWAESLEINLLTTVLCSQQAVKRMRQKGGGAIINTSSVRGIDHIGREGVMAYSAAKAGVHNFTRTLAKEVAPDILVNAIAPGFVHTGYMGRVSEDMKEKWLKEIPIKRFIMPDEIAEVYVLLATTRIMTGSIVIVDGGFTLKLA